MADSQWRAYQTMSPSMQVQQRGQDLNKEEACSDMHFSWESNRKWFSFGCPVVWSIVPALAYEIECPFHSAQSSVTS